ncbi:MAG: multifunctional CCA addition/repair protein [Gammaproteobacteria bacterium]|nr:multifunctional CCA addition/repair protein [Gammaproteobacteria bacterium]
MQVFLVGGAVRDRLLGLETKDRDWVVVGATQDIMLERGFKRVGKDFPVFLHPETKQEYALARTERKVAPGYRGFTFSTAPDITLRQDLERRDLTINAMAETADGELIDYFNGAADLRAGMLRHVSEAFTEDPVRVLRVARFAARFGFRVAAETQALMGRIVARGEVDALVAERVWSEFQRALSEPHPRLFVEVLRDCGALAPVFPEIDALFGVPQPAAYHPEIDTGLHTLLVLEQVAGLSPDAEVRFAALVHDLGKALTPHAEWPHHHGHERHGAVPINVLCTRLRVPNKYRDLALVVCRYHLHLHRIQELKPATVLTLLEKLNAFRQPHRVSQFALACEADMRGRSGWEDRAYPQKEILECCFQASNDVDGQTIAGTHGHGPAIAEEIRRRRQNAIAGVLKERR